MSININTLPPERLAYTLAELKAVTGLSRTTVWRLEKHGLLRAVPGVRSKLYSRAAVEAFLNGSAAHAAANEGGRA